MERYEYYHINDSAKQFAIKELNENPLMVNGEIECFRSWVTSMPHLKCPTSAQFLLKFLRVSKFDYEKAKKLLDNFCTVRSSPRGCPNFFQFFKLDDPIIETYLNLQFLIPLGCCDSGEFVILLRLKQWDPKVFPVPVMVPLIYMGIDALASKEESQIFGVIWLIDIEDITMSLIEALASPTFVRQCYKVIQDSYPIRISGQTVYSDSPIFDVLFQLMSLFMNNDLKSKTFRIPKDVKRAAEIIPGLEKILPTEYNGQGGTLEKCSKKFSEIFKRYFKNGDPLRSIHVDEDKRPKETLSYLTDCENDKG